MYGKYTYIQLIRGKLFTEYVVLQRRSKNCVESVNDIFVE